MVYSILALITLPLFVKKSYTNTLIDVHRITFISTMHIKAYFLNQGDTKNVTISEKQNENYDYNSKIKHKSKTMFGGNRNLVLDIIL